jgi:hypothetical protein
MCLAAIDIIMISFQYRRLWPASTNEGRAPMELTAIPKSTHQECPTFTWNGFLALVIGLGLIGFALWNLLSALHTGGLSGASGLIGSLIWALLFFLAGALVLAGLYTLQPNEAAILQLFGSYRDTTRVAGLCGTNPFDTRRKISLRARNLNGERLKVTDKRGNPIEIAAVVVWRVDDTAKASAPRREFVRVRPWGSHDRRLVRANAARQHRRRRTSARHRVTAAPPKSGCRRGRSTADAPRLCA